MNRENIKKWVDALRSGDYEQGKGHLKRYGAYCCLGVACELYQQETGKGWWDGTDFVVNGDGSVGVLHDAVADWLGISTNPTLTTQGGDVEDAAELNDCKEFDFRAIADAIEHTYLRSEA